MAISQKALAAELNLSTATISRCLNDDPGISLETRSRVLHYAARKGYRGKAKRQTQYEDGKESPKAVNLFAVLIQTDDSDTLTSSFLMPTLGAMSQAAGELGVSLVYHCVPVRHRAAVDEPEHQPEILRGGHAGGVAIIHYFDEKSVARLARQCPVVSLNTPYPDAGVDCVGQDNHWCIARQVAHLRELGHRRLAFVGLPAVDPLGQERLAGYLSAAAMQGADPDSLRRIFRPADASVEAMAGLAEYVGRDGATACVCLNDIVALRVMKWARSAGLRCPQDLSVTGFDKRERDPDFPAITTTEPMGVEVGRKAVMRLIERASQPLLPPMRYSFEGAFVRGESTGPVPSGR